MYTSQHAKPVPSSVRFEFDPAEFELPVVFSSGSWISSSFDDNSIARIDPATNTVASMLTLPGKVVGMTAIGDFAWFVGGRDPDTSRNAAGSLVELGPDDKVLERIALGHGFISGGIVDAFGSLWISNWLKPVVLRLPL